MGKHSMSPRVTTELHTLELSSSPIVATDVRSLRPEKAVEVMPVMQPSSSLNLRRSLMHGTVAAIASFSGVTAISTYIDGSTTAHSSAALQVSLDADLDEDFSEVPAALAGSETAQMRSVAHDIATEAQTTPMCNTEGATGLRAAYVNTDNVLVWPLMPGTYKMVSPFGTRVHPISHTIRMHSGQDLASRAGTPVYAAANGVVDKVGGDVNNTVRIRHEINGEVFYTAYLHMYRNDIIVRVGQTVSAGERIGAVGSAGQSTGAHLHFETHNSSGTPVEPTAFMRNHGAIQMTQMCH
ncbi:MAG: M23 family metallopeptidase [Actinomycetaceae bacterium]|nr:M23 family metallopeptidase [Actinomycetaceae bacterium]